MTREKLVGASFCAGIISFLVCVMLFAHYKAARDDERSSDRYALQLNSQIKDRVSNLLQYELTVQRQIDANEKISLVSYQHDPFAGEDPTFLLQWYDAFVNSSGFSQLSSSLQTLAGEMSEGINNLHYNYEELSSVPENNILKRKKIFNDQISKNITHLVASFQNFSGSLMMEYAFHSKAYSVRLKRLETCIVLFAVIGLASMIAAGFFCGKWFSAFGKKLFKRKF